MSALCPCLPQTGHLFRAVRICLREIPSFGPVRFHIVQLPGPLSSLCYKFPLARSDGTVPFVLEINRVPIELTALDPFGRSEVRVAERSLSVEFAEAMGSVYEHLDADNLDEAIAIANLPDMVRGYEHVKLGRVETFRSELAAAVDSYGRAGARPRTEARSTDS